MSDSPMARPAQLPATHPRWLAELETYQTWTDREIPVVVLEPR